jgi:6-pyruvoyltetrahydropterin/6-carboxytetrahydropterin synthase
MYRITKKFTFSAAHQLKGLPPEHPCSHLHGHNYEVEVVLESDQLTHTYFVRDYRELDELKRHLDAHLDHTNLNDVLPYPTTAECIAQGLFNWCKERWTQVVAVRVSETPKTWAEYHGL